MLDHYYKKLRSLANSGQYKKGYELAKRLRKQYPDDATLIYNEAGLYGDDEDGRTPAEIKVRHKKAAVMYKPWLRKLRRLSPAFRSAFLNEYYWFSHQPYKQYRLGVADVKNKKNRGGYYSQGVGAVELSIKYLKAGRKSLSLLWAKRAEKAWLKFFKLDLKWYNSYCWYAKSLGLQGRLDEMEKALKNAARISGKSLNCEEFRVIRKEFINGRT